MNTEAAFRQRICYRTPDAAYANHHHVELLHALSAKSESIRSACLVG